MYFGSPVRFGGRSSSLDHPIMSTIVSSAKGPIQYLCLSKLFRLHEKGGNKAGGNDLKMFLGTEEVVCVVFKPRSLTFRLVKILTLSPCQLCDLGQIS